MCYTLITGASRGIGYELAKLHAKAGHNLILVARTLDDLQSVQAEILLHYQIQVHIIVMDLSQTDAPEQIYHICKQKNLTIQHLINNAGFGGYGFFQNQDWIQHISMIQTNIIALTQLTYLCLPDMIAHKNGKILQVASTAGMIPGPMQAVYHATKAYVLSLSQALAKELEGTGVTVTALCPGPVDTNFAQVAHLQNSQIFKHAVKANVVAQDGFHALMNGELVVVSGLPMYYRFLLGMMPLFPRSFILNQAKKAICISSDNP